MTNFIQRNVYRGKDVKGFLRPEWDSKMKLKRKQRKSFYLIQAVRPSKLNKQMFKLFLGALCNPCLSDWKRQKKNWNSHPFVVWLQSIALDITQTSKAKPIQKTPNSRNSCYWQWQTETAACCFCKNTYEVLILRAILFILQIMFPSMHTSSSVAKSIMKTINILNLLKNGTVLIKAEKFT